MVGESYQISNAVEGVGTMYRLTVTSNRSDVVGLSEYIVNTFQNWLQLTRR